MKKLLISIVVLIALAGGILLFLNTSSAGPKTLFHCTFDSEDALKSPAVGPAAATCKGPFTFVDSPCGKALKVSHKTSVIYNFPTNFFGPKGAIVLRARILGKETCNAGPTFFGLRFKTRGMTHDDSTATLGFSLNNGEGRSGFCGKFLSVRGATINGYATPFAYSDILGETWQSCHEYRLAWNFTDASALLSLSIDGKLITRNYTDGITPESLAEALKLFESNLAFGANAFGPITTEAYLIDDLKILDSDRL